MVNNPDVRHVVFVCSGNICRSPMAEGIAATLRPDLIVASAATHPIAGRAPTPEAQRVMGELDIDISGYRSTGLSHDRIMASDAIYCMTADHVAIVTRRFPDAAPKVERLLPGVDIEDPYGSDLGAYREVRDQIEVAVRRRLQPPDDG